MRYLCFAILLSVLGNLVRASDDCNERWIRKAIVGYSAGQTEHPDYITAAARNPQSPTLGDLGIKTCHGIRKIGRLEIFPTGAILLNYVPVPTIQGQDNVNCATLSKALMELCKLGRSFVEILGAMENKSLNSSQKYVLLNELLERNFPDPNVRI